MILNKVIPAHTLHRALNFLVVHPSGTYLSLFLPSIYAVFWVSDKNCLADNLLSCRVKLLLFKKDINISRIKSNIKITQQINSYNYSTVQPFGFQFPSPPFNFLLFRSFIHKQLLVCRKDLCKIKLRHQLNLLPIELIIFLVIPDCLTNVPQVSTCYFINSTECPAA